MAIDLTLDEVKRAAKREDFRAGVQMRLLMPRLSVRVTRWVVARTTLAPNQITLVSAAIGLAAAAAFAAVHPLAVAAGLLAYHLHVLLDYVDGEVARCQGTTSVRGAYLDLMTDRVTFPLMVFAAGAGAFRVVGDPWALVLGAAAAFGLLLDKEACDCWYRANAGRGARDDELEDRYVAAPAVRRWWKRLALLGAMARGLTAFLTYTVVAAGLDAAGVPAPLGGSHRLLVLAPFAVLMPLGALVRFLFVYRRGAIPRRQQLV
jgi:phosphatidylglycerophosphate synthase